MIHAALVEDVDALAPHEEAWDRLAVESARPYCAPAWMLAWWRHAAPPQARLRVVVAHEDGELVGLAPLYGHRRHGVERLGLLGEGASNRLVPLAAPGRAHDLAPIFAATLAACRPRPAMLAFEGCDAGAHWPALLAGAWPGRVPARLTVLQTIPAPTVDLSSGDHAAWLAAKSKNFRQQMGRARRKLEASGAAFRRVVDPDELVDMLPGFLRLHRQRLEGKGDPSTLSHAVDAMLAPAARELAARGRMWMWTIEAHGELVSAHLFVAAGGEVAYWLGGFDDAYAAHKPGLVVLVAAVEDAFARGARRLDLGAGAQDYKQRLADGHDELLGATVMPRTGRYPATRAQLLPTEARRFLGTRLSFERKQALRRLVRHDRGGR